MEICMCNVDPDIRGRYFHDCDEQGKVYLGLQRPGCYGQKVVRYRKCLNCGCVYQLTQDGSSKDLRWVRDHTWKDKLMLRLANWALSR